MRNIYHLLAPLLLALVLPVGSCVYAQCARVGWVASVTPGCGAKIIDLDNGTIYRAFFGADALSGGQTLTFSTAMAPVPQGCTLGNGIPVSLTCVSDVLPCVAHYGYYADAVNSSKINFSANIYDANVQICHWDFGDGSTATGKEVSHSFQGAGIYSVCLKVTDDHGCAADFCEDVTVNAHNDGGCGFDMKATAIGTELFGKVFPIDPSSTDTLQSVYWYSSKTSNVLAHTAAFNAPLPGYGSYLVCAQYNVASANSSFTCAATKCQELTVAEPGCVYPTLINTNTLCPGQSAQYSPVCGCNGVTYGNECEAITAGVSSWLAGTCASSGSSCVAQMEVSIVDGSIDNGYIARFINHSGSDYTFAQLDYGDGSPLWEGTHWDTLLHPYPAGGIYRTNLTTWRTGACVSSAVQLLVTDALNMNVSSLPEGTDYVRPGDANKDGKANVYDLLNIGVGNYTTGAPRPDATTAWTLQFSPNWQESVDNAVNYKHLDCDGNGAVNEYDADVISQHYSPVDSTPVAYMPNVPELLLRFPQDTIVVDANNPAQVEIKGQVILGSASKPALGLYGLAFAMEYPEYVGHDPEADYKSDYFGSPNHMLWLSRDNHDRKQLDIGVTRKNGNPANGYGAIADVTLRADFIIIIDVADRSANHIIPFSVPLRGIKAIDKFGKPKAVTTPATQDTVWIKLVGTTATSEALNGKIIVSPNPATDEVSLLLGDLHAESIETVDGFGRVVARLESPADRIVRMPVKDLPPGVYSLKILTDKGLVMKQLSVQ